MISSLDITINGITANFVSVGFGGLSGLGIPVNELIDFSGSVFSGMSTDTVILSNIQIAGTNNFRFNITEIVLQPGVGADSDVQSVPIPPVLWLFASGLLTLLGIRRRHLDAV